MVQKEDGKSTPHENADWISGKQLTTSHNILSLDRGLQSFIAAWPICTSLDVIDQVVKSGYFQLRQTPGVPLGDSSSNILVSAMGIWGMPWVLEMGGIFRILNGTCFIIFRVSNIEMQLWAWPSCADLLVKLRFKLALHSQQAEKLVKPKGLVYLTVGPGVLVVMDCYGINGCWLGCGMFRMNEITTKSLRLWRD